MDPEKNDERHSSEWKDLNRWLDGECDDGEKARVEREIDDRPDLAHAASFLEAVRGTVRGRRRIEPSAGLTARIMDAVFPSAAEPVWILVEPLVKRLAVAASILLLASLALGVLVSGPTREIGAAGPIRTSAVERALLGDTGLAVLATPHGTPDDSGAGR